MAMMMKTLLLLAALQGGPDEAVGTWSGKLDVAGQKLDLILKVTNRYPGLDTALEQDVVGLVTSLTGGNERIKVAFGTEGGLFSRDLDIPTVVCGPGFMDQGHKPDEFVSLDQLASCDAMLAALNARLAAGL